MVAPFHFLHGDRKIYARLIFNLEVIPDVILVIPNISIPEIGEELFFSKTGELEWTVQHARAAEIANTLDYLCNKLENHFASQGFRFLSAGI